MRDYFIRRFLLLIPTLLAITVIVFGITRVVPGGPMDQMMMKMSQVDVAGGSATTDTQSGLSDEQRQEMMELYGYDKPVLEAYLVWLGVMSREVDKSRGDFKPGETRAKVRVRVPDFHVLEMDGNGDGVVEQAEFPQRILQQIDFEAIDRNGNEQVDAEEVTALPKGEITQIRENVLVERNNAGDIWIANPDGLLVDWSVRMDNPPAELLEEMAEMLEEAGDALDRAGSSAGKLAGKSGTDEAAQFQAMQAAVVEVAEKVSGWLEEAEAAAGGGLGEQAGRDEAKRIAGLIKKMADEELGAIGKMVSAKKAATPKAYLSRAEKKLNEAVAKGREPFKVLVYRSEYAGLLQGHLGKSFNHHDAVWNVIKERLPISMYFGLMTFLFTYAVCLPLGIAKAMKHNSWFDNGTSVLIFMGYSIPGYVLAVFLVLFPALKWDWFPDRGFVSEKFHATPLKDVKANPASDVWTLENHGLEDGEEIWLEGEMPKAKPALQKKKVYHAKVLDADTFVLALDPELGQSVNVIKSDLPLELKRHTRFWDQVKDLVSHTVLPLASYLIGYFALLTMLMKNHLMDNLSADYMRTALAKGVPYRLAVRRHAMRNSMIPIATHLGHQVVLLVAGSFLIETIFEINGFGRLGFTAVLQRDVPLVMGVLLVSSSLMLLGNILSDILVALVDPRVRFE